MNMPINLIGIHRLTSSLAVVAEGVRYPALRQDMMDTALLILTATKAYHEALHAGDCFGYNNEPTPQEVEALTAQIQRARVSWEAAMSLLTVGED